VSLFFAFFSLVAGCGQNKSSLAFYDYDESLLVIVSYSRVGCECEKKSLEIERLAFVREQMHPADNVLIKYA
jgi:hypothetical protein